MDIILLEALSNCVRHAGASELYVKCSSEEQEWIMVITDNGQNNGEECQRRRRIIRYTKKGGAMWRNIENLCGVKIFDNR